MATIQLKRSAVPAKIPTTSDLSLGEIAINTYDGKLYIKRSAGTDSIIEFMRADFSNANSLGTGIICGAGGSPQYRSLASGDAAITVTNADGTSGNPTVTFQPGNVAIGNLAGTLSLNKGGTGATTQSGAANAILPPQSTNSGKFLTTNGTNASWATVSASPSGSSKQIQYNNNGSFAGAGNLNVTNGDLELVASSAPSAPSANENIVVYKSTSAYPSISIKHPALGIGNAGDDILQAQIGSKDIGWWNPPGNATTVPGVLGLTAPTASGTATARTVAATTILSRLRRLGYVTAATAGTSCGQSWTVRQWTFGTGSGLGGFYMIYRFAISDASYTLTGNKWTWVGMTTQSGPLTGLPATYCFGMFQPNDGTTSNWKMRCAGGNLATDVDLGADFPLNNTDVYELRLFSSPNDSSAVYYEVVRLGTGDTAVGSFATASLAWSSTTLLAPQAIRNNGTAAAAVGIDIASLYIEKTV